MNGYIKNQEDARILELRIIGWVRFLFGVILAVLVALIIINDTIRADQVSGCHRGVADRIASARKDYQDYLGEIELADESLTAATSGSHERRAIAARRAGVDLLTRTGSPDPRGYQYPNQKQIDGFCNHVYPVVFPNSIWDHN